MSLHELILFDRSRVTTDWNCKRRRFLNYEYGGRGIQNDGIHIEFYLGSVLHDGLAAIAMGADIDAIAEAGAQQTYQALSNADFEGNENYDTYAKEQACLIEGLLRGFYKHAWPRLQEQFPKIIAVEQEMILPLEADNASSPMSRMGPQVPIQMMTKPDLIVEDKDGELWYLEYKSTSSVKDQWFNSWSSQVQLHSSIRAAELALSRPVIGVIIQGLYKGYVAYGKQTSPMCYGYYRRGTPPFYQDEWSYEYRAGLKKFPIWEKEGGVKKWIDEMPERILAEQFPQAAPIYVNNSMIDAFFRQTIDREKEIHMASRAILNGGDEAMNAQILDMAFPQNFSACSPGWGHGCSYKKLCFGNFPDPLEAGYVFRTPHHTPELELWAERDAAAGEQDETNPSQDPDPVPSTEPSNDEGPNAGGTADAVLQRSEEASRAESAA